MDSWSLDRGPLCQNVPRTMHPLRLLLQAKRQGDKKPAILLPYSIPLHRPRQAQRRRERFCDSTSCCHQER